MTAGVVLDGVIHLIILFFLFFEYEFGDQFEMKWREKWKWKKPEWNWPWWFWSKIINLDWILLKSQQCHREIEFSDLVFDWIELKWNAKVEKERAEKAEKEEKGEMRKMKKKSPDWPIDQRKEFHQSKSWLLHSLKRSRCNYQQPRRRLILAMMK